MQGGGQGQGGLGSRIKTRLAFVFASGSEMEGVVVRSDFYIWLYLPTLITRLMEVGGEDAMEHTAKLVDVHIRALHATLWRSSCWHALSVTLSRFTYTCIHATCYVDFPFAMRYVIRCQHRVEWQFLERFSSLPVWTLIVPEFWRLRGLGSLTCTTSCERSLPKQSKKFCNERKKVGHTVFQKKRTCRFLGLFFENKDVTATHKMII